MISSIIFDFGKVIGHFDYRITWNRLRQHTDMEVDVIKKRIREADIEDRYESGRMTTEEFLKEMKSVGQWRCSDDVIRIAWSKIFHHNEPVCRLIPSLANDYRLVLGSNTNDLHAQQFRQQFTETLKHFDYLVLSHEIGVRKPNREFYENCILRAGAPAGNCVFIDDRPENIAGARSVGLHAIHYADGVNLAAELGKLGIRT